MTSISETACDISAARGVSHPGRLSRRLNPHKKDRRSAVSCLGNLWHIF